MTILTFIILALAVYRITHLIVYDKIFEPIRKHFVKRNFDKGLKTLTYTLQGGRIRRLIGSIMNCYWCAGIWVSALLVGCYLLSPTVTTYASAIFALASIQAITETGVLKSMGAPLEMVEVKAELEADELGGARGIKNALIVSVVFYGLGFAIGFILLK